jgi:hypothetical protein
MKLLQSWAKYRNRANYPGLTRPTWYTAFKTLANVLSAMMIVALVFLTQCEEKIPTIQTDEDVLDFKTVRIPSAAIRDTSLIAKSDLASSRYLLAGNHTEAQALILLRFSDFSALPNPLDSVIGVSLRLKSSLLLPEDYIIQTGAFRASILKREEGSSWTETTTTWENFDLNDYTLELLGQLEPDPNDTTGTEFVIPFNPEDSLIYFWRDTSHANYGMVIQKSDLTDGAMVSFYSREGGATPNLKIEYIVDGDTATTIIGVSEDLSVVTPQINELFANALSLDNAHAFRSFMWFNVADSVQDQNALIAKAEIHLEVDTLNSRNYTGSFLVYLTVIDSLSGWGNVDYVPALTDVNTSISVPDTVNSVTIPIRKIAQDYSSGYQENFGVLLWSAPSNYDLSRLILHNTTADDENLRPYLKILTMKER